jgi:hypothetical protein
VTTSLGKTTLGKTMLGKMTLGKKALGKTMLGKPTLGKPTSYHPQSKCLILFNLSMNIYFFRKMFERCSKFLFKEDIEVAPLRLMIANEVSNTLFEK